MATTVAVLGGGVGGLSAAHELAERGFDVTVYEKRARPGGKARSYPTPEGFPAEHGFRFFPAFYRHLPDTMARIPLERRDRARPAGGRGADPARARRRRERAHRARARPGVAGRSRRAGEVRARRRDRSSACPRWTSPGCSSGCSRCSRAATSAAWSSGTSQSWWSYVQADRRSEAFRRYLADGLTRTLVAARAKEMSARTGGLILVQLLLDLSRAGDRADRVLDAPTSDVWIDPWIAHLRSRGVDVRLGEARRGDRGARRADRRRDRRRARRSRPTSTSPRCRSRSCARCSRPSCAPPSRG